MQPFACMALGHAMPARLLLGLVLHPHLNEVNPTVLDMPSPCKTRSLENHRCVSVLLPEGELLRSRDEASTLRALFSSWRPAWAPSITWVQSTTLLSCWFRLSGNFARFPFWGHWMALLSRAWLLIQLCGSVQGERKDNRSSSAETSIFSLVLCVCMDFFAWFCFLSSFGGFLFV